MGACTSRDSTVPPSALSSVLPPSSPGRDANKSSIDLSQPRSSPPSITHPPLPSSQPDSDDPHSRHRAQTVVSQTTADRSLPSQSAAVLPPTVELRAEKEVVWALHGEASADPVVLDVVGGEDGELLTAGIDKYVVRFDWQRRSVRDRWKAHSMPVERLLYCSHMRAVFTASRDSNIRMLVSAPSPSSSPSAGTAAGPNASSIPAATEVVFRGHTLSVSALCFDLALSTVSSAPTALVSGGRDYSLRWWDIATQQQQHMRILPNNIVTALTASSHPSVLLSANTAGLVHQWDSRTREVTHTYDASDATPVVSLSAHHSTPLFLVTHSPVASLSGSSMAMNSSIVRLYDARMQRLVRQTPVDEALVASYILQSSDERQLRAVTVSAGGQVRLWADGTCQSSARVRGDSGVVRCASLGLGGESGRMGASSPSAADGRSVLLYTGSTDGNVCVWSVRDGGRLAVKALVRSRVPQ